MKQFRIFKYAVAAFLALAAVSCANKEKFDEITELDLARCLEPMNLEAKVNANLGDVVTFSWDVAKDAEKYVLTVYTDAAHTSAFLTETLAPSQVPYSVKLEADATYYFTVVAQKEGKIDSKVADYGKSIKTYAVKDNLFLKLAERTSTSVSLTWSKEVSDFEEVDRVVTRLPGDEDTTRSRAMRLLQPPPLSKNWLRLPNMSLSSTSRVPPAARSMPGRPLPRTELRRFPRWKPFRMPLKPRVHGSI